MNVCMYHQQETENLDEKEKTAKGPLIAKM